MLRPLSRPWFRAGISLSISPSAVNAAMGIIHCCLRVNACFSVFIPSEPNAGPATSEVTITNTVKIAYFIMCSLFSKILFVRDLFLKNNIFMVMDTACRDKLDLGQYQQCRQTLVPGEGVLPDSYGHDGGHHRLL